MESSETLTNYHASLSTGIFGTFYFHHSSSHHSSDHHLSDHHLNDRHQYYPSLSSGIFGSYIKHNTHQIEITKRLEHIEIIKTINYCPSNSTGIFGDYRIPQYEVLKKERPVIHLKPAQHISNDNEDPPFQRNVYVVQEWTCNQHPLFQNISHNNIPIFIVASGNVVDFEGDAILNAANEGMLGGGSVDGAISNAGGQPLFEYRLALPIIPGTRFKRCLTGDAKITPSGYPDNKLKCQYVIHAVGPNYLSDDNEMVKKYDENLRQAYTNTMKLARKTNIHSIGISLLSAGVFRHNQSLSKILSIGVEAIYNNLYSGLKEVYMIAFTYAELKELTQVAPQILGQPHKQYSLENFKRHVHAPSPPKNKEKKGAFGPNKRVIHGGHPNINDNNINNQSNQQQQHQHLHQHQYQHPQQQQSPQPQLSQSSSPQKPGFKKSKPSWKPKTFS